MFWISWERRGKQRSQGFQIPRILRAIRGILQQYAAQRKSARLDGGGGGIRTHETLSGLTVFKTAGFNRSPTPPSLEF